jgi:hypothetical protein
VTLKLAGVDFRASCRLASRCSSEYKVVNNASVFSAPFAALMGVSVNSMEYPHTNETSGLLERCSWEGGQALAAGYQISPNLTA